jgi:hypothetical protein
MATDPIRILTAEDIWAAKDIEERTVDVPQWGGAVRIKTFSKRQATALTQRSQRRDPRTGQIDTDNDLLEALIFTEGIIDPELTVEDYERLQDKSAAAVGLILKAIMDASGLTDLAVKEATKSPEAGSNGTLRILSGAGVEDDAG